MSPEKYDLVIFGASGYTGKFVIEYVAKENVRRQGALTWAVGGRAESKLQLALEQAAKNTGIADIENVATILADTSDPASLEKMAQKARVVLNCVGPYRFYGEQVVAACVKSKSHYVDISGEPQFLEKMQLKYHEEAKNNSVYIVGSCGFDSIPSDVGMAFLAKKMAGDVNEIETYLKVSLPQNVGGPAVNFGTWQSAIYGLAKSYELKPLRKQLFPEKLPKMFPPQQKRGLLHFNEQVKNWCLPFPGSDRSVMLRTIRSKISSEDIRPPYISCYFQVCVFSLDFFL